MTYLKHTNTFRCCMGIIWMSLCMFILALMFTGDKWVCTLSCLLSLSISLKTSKKLWLSHVFRGYWKRPVAWDGFKLFLPRSQYLEKIQVQYYFTLLWDASKEFWRVLEGHNTQLAFACSKSTIETLEKGVWDVQS